MKILGKLAFAAALAAMTVIPLCACGGGDSDTEDDNNQTAYLEHRDAPNATVKKGVCVSRYNTDDINNAAKIDAMNAGWYYTWGVKTENAHIDTNFVPMIWGKAQVTQSNINYIKSNFEAGNFTYLLTFNEPDLKDQSNMTVDEALSSWQALESIGIPLSSPAVSYYSATEGNEWLDQFMTKAKAQNRRVDFIAIHLYQSFYSPSAVNDLKATLEALHSKYNLPIWLTEFGAIDIIARDSGASKPSASCTAANAKRYIEQATNMLEQCGYLERYAWFVDNFAGLYGDNRPWEAPYTTLYNDDDTVSSSGTAYKNVISVKPIIAETKTLPNAKKGAAYSEQITVCGGTGNYTFSASGLPAGLKMSPSGKITGTPTTNTPATVKVTVTDSGKSGRRQTLTVSYRLAFN